jgi:hypothetical protein
MRNVKLFVPGFLGGLGGLGGSNIDSLGVLAVHFAFGVRVSGARRRDRG